MLPETIFVQRIIKIMAFLIELFGKFGVEIYDRIRGIDNREVKTLQEQALAAFRNAEKLNSELFKVHYQLAVMYKDGYGASKNVYLAKEHVDKALAASLPNTSDRKLAEDLNQLIQAELVDQKINSGKRIEAKYLANQGFDKLKKFENPHQGSSVEGFDAEALILLGKASVLDATNFDVEYKLAEMYLNGIGTRVDLIFARDHAKNALHSAQNLNNDVFVANAKALLDEAFEAVINEPVNQDESTEKSKKEKRKTIAFIPANSMDTNRSRADSSSSSSGKTSENQFLIY